MFFNIELSPLASPAFEQGRYELNLASDLFSSYFLPPILSLELSDTLKCDCVCTDSVCAAIENHL